jgi:DNA primase
VIVNYDPDSAGVAATERSLALLLEEGFEAKVLALPGGLDPDSFVQRHGGAEYKKLLSAAPTYVDYITERAVTRHGIGSPEDKVAAANAVLPHLAKISNPLLRSELANRLAERLRLDEHLLQHELRRAASQGRQQIEMQATARSLIPAEKQLLRTFLDDDALANQYLPLLVEGGSCNGLATERIFKELLELKRRAERLELNVLADSLEPEDQRLLYESAFWPVDASAEQTALSYHALCRRRTEREIRKLQTEIQEAERAKDSSRLAELLRAKAEMAKQLTKTRPNSKIWM